MRIHRLCAVLLFVASPVFCRQDKTAKARDPSSRDEPNITGTSLGTSEGVNVRGSNAAYSDEEGYSRAARLYLKGLYSDAAAIYEIACDNSNAKACTDLGEMYRHGEGVKKDFARAAELLLRGCDGGNGLGCSNLGLMYWYGIMPKDDNRAVALFRQGCDERDNDACRVLGFMYENGQGVTKDPKRAAIFYQRAREHQIPFTVKDRLMLIETTVNGAQAKLIVDSGGTTVLGMKFLPSPTADSPIETLDSLHGSSAVYPITVVWTLDGKDKHVRAVAGDLNFPNNCDGILGADTLETFKSARFDFQTSVLTLEDSEVAEGVAGSDVLGSGHAQ